MRRRVGLQPVDGHIPGKIVPGTAIHTLDRKLARRFRMKRKTWRPQDLRMDWSFYPGNSVIDTQAGPFPSGVVSCRVNSPESGFTLNVAMRPES